MKFFFIAINIQVILARADKFFLKKRKSQGKMETKGRETKTHEGEKVVSLTHLRGLSG